MTQVDVYNFLKARPGMYYSSFEIADKMGITVQAVRRALNKLVANGDVEFVEHDIPKNNHVYPTRYYAYPLGDM